MKKFLLIACVIILLVLARDRADQLGLTEHAGGAARSATLPFKIAWLSMKEPDSKLVVPVEGIIVEGISNSWHAPRSGNRLHEGQDIFAQRGTAVRSATEGYVSRVGESPLGGKTVFVAGAGGRHYYYAHLDNYAVDLAVGDYVTPETVLGYVGTTGNAAGTPPHLHFGVYTISGAIDPLPLLTDRSSRGGM